jgi:hypothetical protein
MDMFLQSTALFLGSIAASAAIFAAPFVAAWFIRSVVRWINNRDDPRQAKRPANEALEMVELTVELGAK